MAEAEDRLSRLITHGREERYLEYKGSGPGESLRWSGNADTGDNDNTVREKLARSIMAMANLEEGGDIVLGMEQVGPDNWDAAGLSDDAANTFRQDSVQEWVNERADPSVQLTVYQHAWRSKQFVIVRVQGFDEVPVVGVRGTGSRQGLRESAMYVRSRGKHETAEVSAYEDMRSLLDRAIDIGIERRLKPFGRLLESLLQLPTGGSRMDEERFQQRQDDL